MGKKSGPSPPDYAGAAQQTAEGNQAVTTQQTWANRPDISTPWGSQTWKSSSSIDPATGKPVTSWSSNISLTPAEQQALDSQQQIQQGRSEAALSLLDQATSGFSSPIDYSTLPARSSNIAPLSFGGSVPTLGRMKGSIAPTSSQIQNPSAFNFGPITNTIGGAGQGISDSLTPASNVRQQAQDAVWKLQQPMLDARRSDTENQLANMGLARGSEAWNREDRALSDNEERARLAAIEAGRIEAGQEFGQNLQAGQFGNQAQAQRFGQNAAEAEFGNQAQAQQAGENLAQLSANNQAQAQEFGQNLQGAQFQNQNIKDIYGAAMQSAQMGDTRMMEELQSALQTGNFNNINRSGALAELIQQRGLPLNELNAMLTGQQVAMPNMPTTPTAGKAASPDYLSAAENLYGAQVSQANAQQGSINNLLGSLGNAAAMYFAFSDRRLKHRIEPLGLLSTGVRVVHYEYIGLSGRYCGVIAQELQAAQPEAVFMHPSGYLMVDYSKVRA